MKRLVATLRWDVVLQFRNGFYYVSAFFILIWVALWRQLPNAHTLDYALIVPGLVVLNLLITTFYFVGALVLLEKAEDTLTGLVVTPLHAGEYLAARVLSLSLLATLETVLIVLLIYGLDFQVLPLLAGMLLLSGFYTLMGFVAIARYDSINEYILPSGIIVFGLVLPLADHVGWWRSPIFYLHPIQPALVLLRAAFEPMAPWRIAYGLLGALLWLGISAVWAYRTFDRFVVRAAGD
jgi:fluoroquinolone transport system permease protein